MTSNYARVSVVQFDHGVGLSSGTGYTEGIFHYMFEDNSGTRRGPLVGGTDTNWNGVFDADIYQKTSAVAPDGITFAFINSCLSADYNNSYGALTNDPYYINYGITQGLLPDGSCRSLPYAFMHRVVMDPTLYGFNVASHMSNNGYSNPDHGSQVYIGFSKGSASLSQNIPSINENDPAYGEPYWAWVDRFFAAAVSSGNSVNNALDLASIQTWGSSFGSSPLSTGFTPYWPINGSNGIWPLCTMSVYGNGLIQLNSFSNMFVDHNYNNWAVNWGSWSAASGNLVNSRGPSMITTNSAFTTNRHVRVTVTTTQAGSNNWDVPWIVAKLGSGGIDYNSVYGLIHTDGTVELAAMVNGQKYMWQTPSSLNPLTPHVIDINTVGNVGYLYVDGILYHKQDNACFGSFGGQTALLTAGNSAGAFNKVSVLGQSYANTRWSDNFDDGSLNTNLWASIQVNGGTVQETQQQLLVKKLSGSGWSQAGVVSQNSYNMQGACVSVNVLINADLDEMQLLIGTTKSTTGDPINSNNLYRIGLIQDQSGTIVIQRRVDGVFTTLYSNPWLSETGQLSILVLNGVISFYENNVWLYSENYALPSPNCYIYVYASSNTGTGTNAFDNFEYVKTS